MHIPQLARVAARQERPVVPDEKRAAVGHLNVTLHLSVIQDAPKVHGHSLELEIGEEDFSPNSDLLLARMLEQLYLQSLLCHPAIQMLLVSRVKSDGEMTFLPYLQLHWLQGD